MTICFFSAQYLPTVGGVERYTHSLGVQLLQKGHRVLVITSAVPGLPARETQDGIELVRLPSWRLMGGRFPVLLPSGALCKIRALVQRAAPDLIVIQTRFYPLSLLGARCAKQLGIRALVLEHGTAHLLRGGLAGALGNAYEHAMLRLVRRQCDNLYGVSKACAAWLTHFGVRTEHVLYNAVDPAALQALAAACGTDFLQPYLGADAARADVASADAAGSNAIKAAAAEGAAADIPAASATAFPSTPSFAANGVPNKRAASALPTATTGPRPIVIAFSGRFIPEKGVLPLLEAFGTVRKAQPHAVLLLAGDGPQLAAAKAALPEGAHLLGMLPYAQSLALLARADVYCLPTFSEGFSTSVLEAAALRAAILTTATGGSPELLVTEQHGILLPDMRADTIAAALDKALSNAVWRATAQENAYQRLLQQFTWDKVSDALLAIAVQGATQ